VEKRHVQVFAEMKEQFPNRHGSREPIPSGGCIQLDAAGGFR
jgi:hypothetical protein